MKHIEQKQKIYEINPVLAGDLIEVLIDGGTWDEESVPENILGISLSPAMGPDGERLGDDKIAVGVVYVTLV